MRSVRSRKTGLRFSTVRRSFVSKATGKFVFRGIGRAGGKRDFENDSRKMSTDGRNVNICRVIPQFGAKYLATGTVLVRMKSVQMREQTGRLETRDTNT